MLTFGDLNVYLDRSPANSKLALLLGTWKYLSTQVDGFMWDLLE